MPILVYTHTILMKLAFLQIPLVWESPNANRLAIETYLNGQDFSETDILVLPETFTTGFSMQATHLSELMNGDTITWMQSLANQYALRIAGSIMVKEEGSVYNRFLVVDSKGIVGYYNKKHLFGLGAEKELITAGKERTTLSINDWRVNLQICYDLRFPVWMRNTDETDLIMIVANWPSPRIQAWRSLLVARAIENQCYVLGVNRLGEDGNKLSYTGDSMLVGPSGQIILDAGNDTGLFFADLDKNHLMEFRAKFPFLNDADVFDIK